MACLAGVPGGASRGATTSVREARNVDNAASGQPRALRDPEARLGDVVVPDAPLRPQEGVQGQVGEAVQRRVLEVDVRGEQEVVRGLRVERVLEARVAGLLDVRVPPPDVEVVAEADPAAAVLLARGRLY